MWIYGSLPYIVNYMSSERVVSRELYKPEYLNRKYIRYHYWSQITYLRQGAVEYINDRFDALICKIYKCIIHFGVLSDENFNRIFYHFYILIYRIFRFGPLIWNAKNLILKFIESDFKVNGKNPWLMFWK